MFWGLDLFWDRNIETYIKNEEIEGVKKEEQVRKKNPYKCTAYEYLNKRFFSHNKNR